MKFSVCIGTVRPTTLRSAVDSILRQTWSDWELILITQGHDGNIQQAAESLCQFDSRVRHVHLEERGLSRARNAGIRASTGNIIAMTDDDCEAREDWLATLAEYFQAEPDLGLVGGALILPKPSRRGPARSAWCAPSEALYDPVATGRHAPGGWTWEGGNFALRRAVAERAGLFDELLGAGSVFRSAEDMDYKLRLETLGVKMRSTPRSVVYHTHGLRYGFRAVLDHAAAYAVGMGAVAGKLTLQGDPRGKAWLARVRRECTIDWMRNAKLHRASAGALRLWHFTRAYQTCIRNYRVDAIRHVLVPAHLCAMAGIPVHVDAAELR